VSLLFPDRLIVSLAPGQVTSARMSGLLRKRVVERKTIPCDPGFGAEPWQGAIGGLSGLDRTLRASAVLSNHFARYAIVPWNEGLDTADEEEAYVRHHFAKVHGERAKAWALRWSEHGATRLASAIDQALLDALKQALPRLDSVQPLLMAAINRCRAAIPRSGAWLALVEDERACIALYQAGQWRSVQNARGAWLDALERERHRAAGEAPDLALLAGTQVNGEVPGWKVRELQLAL
jgi:hypothetical protein